MCVCVCVCVCVNYMAVRILRTYYVGNNQNQRKISKVGRSYSSCKMLL